MWAAAGSNSSACLALGHTDDVHTFQPLNNVLSGAVKRLWTGGRHTFLEDTSGRLYACGDNEHGQLGLVEAEWGNKVDVDAIDVELKKATSSSSSNMPRSLNSSPSSSSSFGRVGAVAAVWRPVVVLPFPKSSIIPLLLVPPPHPHCLQIRLVACGWSHTAILTEDGRLFTFGCAQDGRLGIHERDGVSAATAAAIANGATGVNSSTIVFNDVHVPTEVIVMKEGLVAEQEQSETAATVSSSSSTHISNTSTTVSSGIEQQVRFRAVACSEKFSLAISSCGQHVYGWGSARHGVLGSSRSRNSSSSSSNSSSGGGENISTTAISSHNVVTPTRIPELADILEELNKTNYNNSKNNECDIIEGKKTIASAMQTSGIEKGESPSRYYFSQVIVGWNHAAALIAEKRNDSDSTTSRSNEKTVAIVTWGNNRFGQCGRMSCSSNSSNSSNPIMSRSRNAEDLLPTPASPLLTETATLSSSNDSLEPPSSYPLPTLRKKTKEQRRSLENILAPGIIPSVSILNSSSSSISLPSSSMIVNTSSDDVSTTTATAAATQTTSNAANIHAIHCVSSGWHHMAALIQVEGEGEGAVEAKADCGEIGAVNTTNTTPTDTASSYTKPLRTKQLVYTWGRASYGQLGNYSSHDTNHHQNLPAAASPTIATTPSLSLSHSSAFSSSTTSLFRWEPMPVKLPDDESVTPVSVACGAESTHIGCLVDDIHSYSSSIVATTSLSSSVRVYSIGWNEHGNLGIGDATGIGIDANTNPSFSSAPLASSTMQQAILPAIHQDQKYQLVPLPVDDHEAHKIGTVVAAGACTFIRVL